MQSNTSHGVCFANLQIQPDNDEMSLLRRRTTVLQNSKGFTLLEVMVVLVLVATLSGFMVTRLANPSREMKRFVVKFSLVTGRIQYQAKLFNTTYRLVLDLDENELDGIPQRYWIEKSTATGVVMESEPEKAKEEQGESSIFEMDTKIFKEVQQFPPGLKLTQVELTRRNRPITEGRAYIYFLPQGMVDEAAIQLNYDENKFYTIITNPMSGKSDLVPRQVPLKEVRNQ
ncbi:MAG: prepilin-type N-terminal cleavage/methylation domain-containing protein [Bdellovibrionales bacterium]